MSFVRTLAALAVGFAAARGFDRYRAIGGMEGLRDAMQANPALAPMAEAMGRMTGAAGQPADLRGGLAAMLGAMGGAAATGMQNLGAMIDQMTGTGTATAAIEANARLMIRAMIMAAKADGAIGPEERAAIEAQLADASEEERAFVAAEMAAEPDPVALARDVAEGARAQVYAAAATVTRADTPAEQQFLAALGGALGLDRATRTALHAQAGIAPPAA
jgi:uncharacterized membrane protein YebE (DUF533 family)